MIFSYIFAMKIYYLNYFNEIAVGEVIAGMNMEYILYFLLRKLT